ncbi:hypothetical protein [Mycobacterium celatum]|uniref:hypothetical protein n=1 Tax=Mycobacterium celatum TaxID=28045 RepID=UPI00278C0091|nr:hypothetical protein [Mycobacterium celatum]
MMKNMKTVSCRNATMCSLSSQGGIGISCARPSRCKGNYPGGPQRATSSADQVSAQPCLRKTKRPQSQQLPKSKHVNRVTMPTTRRGNPDGPGEMIELTTASSFIDWEELTGQSQFVVDLVSIPIFSAIAGLITNWTGVLMLFAPVHFTGFHMRGLKTIFPLLPRKVQILPIFAPNGVLGFQGFIPCRAEKMASLIVDKSIFRIGGIADFYQELEPDASRNNYPKQRGRIFASWRPTFSRRSMRCCGRYCRSRRAMRYSPRSTNGYR